MIRRLFERDAVRYRRKQCIAISDREGLSCRRRAGVHDQRACSAIGFRLGPYALQFEETSVEIEILLRRPRQLDDVEPFLRVFVACLVIAQRRAEHLELALVPAAYDIETETPFADVVGRDELLACDKRRDQRRMHSSEHGEQLGLG